jgi:hypothetical protein
MNFPSQPKSAFIPVRTTLASIALAAMCGSACLLHADDTKKNPPPKVAVRPAPAKPAPKTNTAPPVSHPPVVNHPINTAPTNHPGPVSPVNRPNSEPSVNHNINNPSVNHQPMSGPPTPIRSLAPTGSQTKVTSSGSAIRTRPSGSVSDVHNAKLGMDVHNNLGGGRRVVVERPDHSVIVAERGRPGFIQRPYAFHGQDYAVRNYVYRGHAYNQFYRGYPYRGLTLNVYAPGVYYHPAFYGWAYNPWAAPITFSWGWRAHPWYAHFGYYFQPYPTYPSAAFWLTDYMISQDLQASYAANQAAGEADGTPPPPPAAGDQPAGDQSAQAPTLTPEVKQAIADEVKNQLALENSEAQQNTAGQTADPGSSGIARLLSDGRPHTFVAGGHLDVTDDSGKECVVSDGDTLQLRQPPPNDSTVAKLVVLSSKGQPECEISLTVQVTLADLQEMQNHMRETIDKGLQDLQAKQGTDGLPAAPPSAQGDPAPAAYAAVAPPPDPNAATEIQQQNVQATQAVQDVKTESAAQPAGAGGQATAVPPATAQPGPVPVPE